MKAGRPGTRANVKRRQLYRRVTIIVVVVAILALLIGGFYYAYIMSNALERYDLKPVTPPDLVTLKQLSSPPYGPPSALMISAVKTISGTPYTSGGRPVVVYIGADYCMYCAAQRWSIVMTLLRFGNISGLEYMSSSPAEGDLPTFTFQSAHYASRFIVFQGFEQEDRNNQPLQTVPSNYTGVFSNYGSAYPFLNFGDKYVISGALWAPSSLENDNWTSVYTAIGSNTTLGNQIKAGANVMTALVCRLTNNQPASVCDEPPISSITLSVSYLQPLPPGSALLMGVPADYIQRWGTPPHGVRQE